MRGLPRWLMAVPVAVLAVSAACGGGSSSPDDAEARISDPASAPTALPMLDAPKYLIKDNVVTLPEASTTVTAGGMGGSPTTAGQGYTIQPLDTCGGIASSLGVTVDELIEANDSINSDCTNLQPGQVLQVPGAAAAPTAGAGAPAPTPTSSGETYIVESGDTCLDIATQFDVSVDDLIELNGLDAACQDLDVGQEIRIP